jgi:hypothetical protein
MRTGGVEPPQSVTLRLQRSELAGAQRPQACCGGNLRGRSTVPRFPSSGFGQVTSCAPKLSCSRHSEIEMAAGKSSAGGIRTHGLELMRLAGTAAPLPRKSGWLESNQRSPVPETGGVARLPHSQIDGCSRRPWNRTTHDRRIRAAPPQPARRRFFPPLDPRLRRGRSLKASASPPQLPRRLACVRFQIERIPEGFEPGASCDREAGRSSSLEARRSARRSCGPRERDASRGPTPP